MYAFKFMGLDPTILELKQSGGFAADIIPFNSVETAQKLDQRAGQRVIHVRCKQAVTVNY